MDANQQTQIWKLFSQTWGHKFLDQYGPVPNEAWSASLDRVTTEQARYALTKLIESGTPYPPTLPEFIVLVKACKPQAVPAILMHKRPEMTPEQVEARRKEMHELTKDLGYGR